MQPSPEITLDLTAPELLGQELPHAAEPAGLVEVNDICEVDPLLRTGSFAANAAPLPQTGPDQIDDSVEIELTAEQMETMMNSPGPG